MKDSTIDGTVNESDMNIKPQRLVDYFLIVGVGKCSAQDQDLNSNDFTPETAIFSPTIFSTLPLCRKDTPIPDLLPMCVFPLKIRLSKEERKPTLFSFVLTDSNNHKLYCTTLHIWEIIEPDDITQHMQKLIDSTQSMLYAPKALTVISHYPFYHLFSQFLHRLYHISLSNAPLPVERYIVNFVHEVPLPPQGISEVIYSFPGVGSNYTISRPPQNRLPMVDFSYRALFSSLSIDNVIRVFRCLCDEQSICIVSNNLALLTPVQETLLSFLYPLEWQGCYIPVLPLSLVEIIEAPVPFLIGVHSSYYSIVPEHRIPESVVYVDLDNGKIAIGNENVKEDSDLNLPSMLPVTLSKLKNSLISCAYLNPEWRSMRSKGTAGVPFPNGEQFNPITFDKNETFSFIRHDNNSIESKDLDSKYNGENSNLYQPFQICTKENYAVSTNKSSCVKPISILDPKYNTQSYNGFEDTFDSSLIRMAFLRVFVVTFIDYSDFFSGGDIINNNNKKTSFFGRRKTLSRIDSPSIDKIPSSLFSVFDFDGFTKLIESQKDNFGLSLLQTQMFQCFITERIEQPNIPAVKFFNENIEMKKNRSNFTISKNSLPFLSDKSFVISNTVVSTEPYNRDIPDNQCFTYTIFPEILTKSKSLVDFRDGMAIDTRHAKVLITTREENRVQNKNNSKQVSIFQLAFKKKQNGSLDINDIMNSTSESSFLSEKSLSNRHPIKVVIDENEQTSCFAKVKARNIIINTFIIKIQSQIRKNKVLKQFKKVMKSVLFLQSFFRKLYNKRVSYRMERFHHLTLTIGTVIKVQSTARRFIQSLRSRRSVNYSIRVQSVVRKYFTRKIYLINIAKVRFAKSILVGYITRQRQFKILSQLFSDRRKQLLLLWQISYTSLKHRSQFWLTICVSISYLHLSVIVDELRRLYYFLQLCSESNVYIKDFDNEFNKINNSKFFKDAIIASNSLIIQNQKSLSGGEIFPDLSSQLPYPFRTIIKLNMKQSKEIEIVERKELYNILKTSNDSNDEVFDKYGMIVLKKRKQLLANSLWNCTDFPLVEVSSKIICELFHLTINNSYPGIGYISGKRIGKGKKLDQISSKKKRSSINPVSTLFEAFTPMLIESEYNRNISKISLTDVILQRRKTLACVESVQLFLLSRNSSYK
jgi:hypothetical protein